MTFLSPSVLLALLSGAALVVQQALNAGLRGGLHSAAWAGFASYLGGTLFMLALAGWLRDPPPALAVATRVPWWVWGGGLFGGIYIALAIVLVPRLGTATYVGLLVAGQMATAVVVDQFGLLGVAPRLVDGPRLAGLALILGGVLLIRR